jgi:hypothetical protein
MANPKVVRLSDHQPDDGLIQPDESVRQHLDKAEYARKHHGRDWEFHLDMYRPIAAFEAQLREIIRPNDGSPPEHQQRWRDSMGRFLRQQHYHEDDPEAPWTGPERTNLGHCWEHLHEVEKFRAEYGQNYGVKKLKTLNSPSLVWSRFKKWKGWVTEKPIKPGAKDEVLRLVQVLDNVCDALHCGKGGEYGELMERLDTFDGSNFVGMTAEDFEKADDEWGNENDRLTRELDKAQAGLNVTIDELTKTKAQREKQADHLTHAFDLLKAFAAGDTPLAETKMFLDELYPPQPESHWGDLWDQQQKKAEPQTPPAGDEVAAETPTVAMEPPNLETAGARTHHRQKPAHRSRQTRSNPNRKRATCRLHVLKPRRTRSTAIRLYGG